MKIPSSKSIAVWTLLLSICAFCTLMLFSSCRTVQSSVTDTIYVAHRDTLKEVHYVKDTESEKLFKTIMERMETEKNTLHTLILSEKGDTIKEYHETVIEKNNTTETDTYKEYIKSVTDSLNAYRSAFNELVEKINNMQVVDSRSPIQEWFDNIKSNIFYIVVGVLIVLVVILYIRKK